jgi:perosamine synthetase
MMRRPILISLSPNTQKDDVTLALKILFSPVHWYEIASVRKLEKQFAKRFGKGYKALAVSSGRGALSLILRSVLRGKGDVALQALTCVAVPNSIISAGFNPKYIDIDKSLNISAKDLRGKINKKTKAVVVQHTFGIPADISKIKKIARKNDLLLIEDCAVSLGAKYKGKEVGKWGDVAFFSFGRDKIMSSVFGGMILVRDKRKYEKIKKERDRLTYPKPQWLVKQLIHPLIMSLVIPLYFVGFGKFTLGKMILFLSQKAGLLTKAVFKVEESGKMFEAFPAKMPGSLAKMAINQLTKVDLYNKVRKRKSAYYHKALRTNKRTELIKVRGEPVWCRYPVIVSKKNNLLECAKNRNVLLGDWYKQVVTPVSDLHKVRYVKGSCRRAEKASWKLINLPTYPTMPEGGEGMVIKVLEECQNTK